MADQADLVVVGAGTVGGWASVFAAADGVGRTVVLERGLAGMGASSRAAGIVRAQGGTPATVALGLTKRCIHRALGVSLVEAMEAEANALELSSRAPDFKEGLAAFGEKRSPRFDGR